jgi:hypothetical protein
MRHQSLQLLEVRASQNVPDLLQLETEFSIKQNLLQDQELWFFIEAVPIRRLKRGFEEPNFVVEVQRTHAHP